MIMILSSRFVWQFLGTINIDQHLHATVQEFSFIVIRPCPVFDQNTICFARAEQGVWSFCSQHPVSLTAAWTILAAYDTFFPAVQGLGTNWNTGWHFQKSDQILWESNVHSCALFVLLLLLLLPLIFPRYDYGVRIKSPLKKKKIPFSKYVVL